MSSTFLLKVKAALYRGKEEQFFFTIPIGAAYASKTHMKEYPNSRKKVHQLIFSEFHAKLTKYKQNVWY